MTTSTNSLFDAVADLVEGLIESATPSPAAKEASNTTGGTWEPTPKEASNTTGGSIAEEGEILNPFIEAQRVLAKVEEIADTDLKHEPDVKAAILLEIAKAHTEVGKQLLEDFIR